MKMSNKLKRTLRVVLWIMTVTVVIFLLSFAADHPISLEKVNQMNTDMISPGSTSYVTPIDHSSRRLATPTKTTCQIINPDTGKQRNLRVLVFVDSSYMGMVLVASLTAVFYIIMSYENYALA